VGEFGTARNGGKIDLSFVVLGTAGRANRPGEKSWSVEVTDIATTTFDLSVKNPNVGEAVAHRSPQEIMEGIAALDGESAKVLGNIKTLLK